MQKSEFPHNCEIINFLMKWRRKISGDQLHRMEKFNLEENHYGFLGHRPRRRLEREEDVEHIYWLQKVILVEKRYRCLGIERSIVCACEKVC